MNEQEMRDELSRLRMQVKELQGRGTELLNEGRMWKLRFKAAHTLLRAVLLEDPFKRFLNRIYPEDEMSRTTALDGVAEVAARVDLLEKDAWTKAGGLAREFVQAADWAERAHDLENATLDKAVEFVRDWRVKFKAALGD